MYNTTIAKDYRIVNVTSTTTRQPLRKLVDDVLAAATKTLPPGVIIQIALTASADTLISDPEYVNEMTLPGNVRTIYPVLDALNKICVKNDATINVEMFFDSK